MLYPCSHFARNEGLTCCFLLVIAPAEYTDELPATGRSLTNGRRSTRTDRLDLISRKLALAGEPVFRSREPTGGSPRPSGIGGDRGDSAAAVPAVRAGVGWTRL